MRGRRCSSHTRWILFLLALPLVAVTAVSATRAVAAAGCAWSSEFAPADLWNIAESMVVWDDGSGEALYVGGGFPTAGGQEVGFVARWDG